MNVSQGFDGITPGDRMSLAVAGARLVADHAPLMDRYGVGPGWDLVTGHGFIPGELRTVSGQRLSRRDDRLLYAEEAGYIRDGSNTLASGWSTWTDSKWALTVDGLRILRDADLCNKFAAAVRDHQDHDQVRRAEMVEFHLGQIYTARP